MAIRGPKIDPDDGGCIKFLDHVGGIQQIEVDARFVSTDALRAQPI